MVTTAEWVAVISRYPRRYKYHGVRGFASTVVEAIMNDERLSSSYYDDLVKIQYDSIKADEESDYKDASDDIVWELASHAASDIFSEWLEGRKEELLEKHPPLEVNDPAAGSEEGVALKDVIHWCPSCGRQPVFIDGNYVHNHKYCGLCGLETYFECFDDMVADLGTNVFPYITDKAEWTKARERLASLGEYYRIKKPLTESRV